jgi:ubiquinone/menaquinone biosynthesis C-methylase UbiE
LRKLILRGLLYDLLIETILKRIKERVARFVSQYDLFPVLDMCCGTGKQCHLIESNGHRAIGVDIDPKMIEYAALKYPHLLFICADAARIPLQKNSLSGVVISYALHDKPPEMRTQILSEAKRLLVPDGKIILVDFENAWDGFSRLGGFFTWIIERLAGGEHYTNRQQFLRKGGLKDFIEQSNLVEVERRNIELAVSSIVVAQFKEEYSSQ